MKSRTYLEMLDLLIHYPFKFYFTAQGYHYTSQVSFMLYLIFIFFYLYLEREDHDDVRLECGSICKDAMEITLWTMNASYILFEFIEWMEKGTRDYFNLGVKGQTNLLDALICFVWISLFILRLIYFRPLKDINSINVLPAQSAYVAIFGCQILLVTLRGLIHYSNTFYVGTILKVLKLMGIEIMKFVTFFFLVMFGFVCGLWIINSANRCNLEELQDDHEDECDDFEIYTFKETIQYVFSVFLGLGDLDGVVNQGVAIFFMVIATLVGALTLNNLLISIMGAKYEEMKDKAKGEVIYNRAELTYDLSKRSRILPPPFTIIVLAVTFIIDIANFFLALVSSFTSCWGCTLNIYAKLDYHAFFNLRNFHIWIWDYEEWKSVKGTRHEYETANDILRWYFVAPWYDWIKPKLDHEFLGYISRLNRVLDPIFTGFSLLGGYLTFGGMDRLFSPCRRDENNIGNIQQFASPKLSIPITPSPQLKPNSPTRSVEAGVDTDDDIPTESQALPDGHWRFHHTACMFLA